MIFDGENVLRINYGERHGRGKVKTLIPAKFHRKKREGEIEGRVIFQLAFLFFLPYRTHKLMFAVFHFSGSIG